MPFNHATMQLPLSPAFNIMSDSPSPPKNRFFGTRAGTRIALAVLAWLTGLSFFPAQAEINVALWHAMYGERERQLQTFISQFNDSQPDHKIKLVFKGSYSETVMAAIFAVRTRSHPA